MKFSSIAVFVVLAFVFVLFFGCTTVDPAKVVQAYPEFESFFASHPDVKIVVQDRSLDQIAVDSIFLDNCLDVELNGYYKVTVTDNNSGLKAYAFVDHSKNVVCSVIENPVVIPPKCNEDWVCEEWSTCSNSSQSRRCVDASKCGTTKEKPVTGQSCVIGVDPVTKAPCKESDWTSRLLPSFCPQNGIQNRAWEKLTDCEGGVTHVSLEDLNCVPTNPVQTCTSFTYTSWFDCNSTGKQTRNVIISSPMDCNGGNPVTVKDCNYVPPCADYNYSSWGDCQSNGTQLRTVISKIPSVCVDGNTPVLSKTCTYVPPCTVNDWNYSLFPIECPSTGEQMRSWNKIGVCDSIKGVNRPVLELIDCNVLIPVCNDFNYSSWSECSDSNIQSRTILTSSPQGCQGGNPQLSQSCIPTGKKITSFTFSNPQVSGVIDDINHSIIVTVPSSTTLTSLTPTIIVSPGASVTAKISSTINAYYPQNSSSAYFNTMAAAGELINSYPIADSLIPAAKALALKNDRPIIFMTGTLNCDYTVSAINNVFSTEKWKSYAKAKGLTIIWLNESQYLDDGRFIRENITYNWSVGTAYPHVLLFDVLPATDVSNTYVTITEDPTRSEGQMGGKSNSPFRLGDQRLTALDSDKVNYIADFTYRAGNCLWVNGACVAGQDTPKIITPEHFIERIEYYLGGALADISSVNNTITVTGSGTSQNFSIPVTYTVTASNGSTQDYVVTVVKEGVTLSSSKAITSFYFPSIGAVGIIDEINHTITVDVPSTTYTNSMIPTIQVSSNAVVSPSSGQAKNFSNVVVYTVTAQDQTTQTYGVRVVKAPAPEQTESECNEFSPCTKTYNGQSCVSLSNANSGAYKWYSPSSYACNSTKENAGATLTCNGETYICDCSTGCIWISCTGTFPPAQ